MTDIVAYLNFYILIANVIIMVIMSVFLHKHKDLKGRLLMLEAIQDYLRQRVKDCDTAIGHLGDYRTEHASKIESLGNRIARIEETMTNSDA